MPRLPGKSNPAVTRAKARRLSRPGKVTLHVEGIYTVTGQLVLPLRGMEHREGDPGCYGESCALVPFFFWIKGMDASLPPGTLVRATVSQPTFFDRGSIVRIQGNIVEARKEALQR